MDEDGILTTCHAAFPFDNGTVISLRVATDGEGYVTTVSAIRNFPDGPTTDLFEDSILAADFLVVSGEKILLADTVGLITEINRAKARVIAELDNVLAGIYQSSSVTYAYGIDGAVFASPTWSALPRLRADVLSVCEADKGQLYVCGSDGLFARFSDEVWEEIDLGTNVSLNVACVLPDGGILVLGMNGFAGIMKDEEWSLLNLPQLDFYDACVFRGETYIGAGSDGLHVLQNGELVLVKDNVISYTLRSCTQYLAIAGDNEIVRYDGIEFPFVSFEDELDDD
jgi:hypothetical protein